MGKQEVLVISPHYLAMDVDAHASDHDWVELNKQRKSQLHPSRTDAHTFCYPRTVSCHSPLRIPIQAGVIIRQTANHNHIKVEQLLGSGAIGAQSISFVSDTSCDGMDDRACISMELSTRIKLDRIEQTERRHERSSRTDAY